MNKAYHFILFFFILLNVEFGYSQSPTFSKMYDTYGLWEYFGNSKLFANDSILIVNASTIDLLNEDTTVRNTMINCNIAINVNGELKNKKANWHVLSEGLGGNFNAIIDLTDKKDSVLKLFQTLSHYDSINNKFNPNKSLIIWVDKNLDSSHTTFIEKISDSSYIVVCIEKPDKYIGWSREGKVTTDSKYFIVYNKEGKITYKKKLNLPIYNNIPLIYLTAMFPHSDSTYFIVGNKDMRVGGGGDRNHPMYRGYTYSAIVDDSGTIIHQNKYYIYTSSAPSGNSWLPFGNNYYFGGTTFSEGDSIKELGFLCKVNQDGDSLWCKRYEFQGRELEGNYSAFGDHMLLSHDNHIVTTGICYYSPPGLENVVSPTVSLLMKIDTNGEEKWRRHFYTNYYTQWFNSLQHSFDGKGFIMIGTAVDTTHSYGHQDGWIVITDSMGCVVPGCHLTNAVQEILPKQKIEVNLFPNPNRGLFEVELLSNKAIQTDKFEIMDKNGKVLLSKPVNENHGNRYKVQLPGIASGMYFIQFYHQQRLVAGKKFVRE